MFALILEAFVALAHAVVGDQGVDLLFRQGFEVAFGVVASIGGVEGVRGGVCLAGADDGEQ